MVCIEPIREAGNEGGGGEKVMDCTKDSHTTLKCFLRHTVEIESEEGWTISSVVHRKKTKLDCYGLQRYLSMTVFSQQRHKENISSRTVLFSLGRMQHSSP